MNGKMKSLFVIIATLLLAECLITVVGTANANEISLGPKIFKLNDMPLDENTIPRFKRRTYKGDERRFDRSGGWGWGRRGWGGGWGGGMNRGFGGWGYPMMGGYGGYGWGRK